MRVDSRALAASTTILPRTSRSAPGIAVDENHARCFSLIVHDYVTDDSIADECELAGAGRIRQRDRGAVEVGSRETTALALIAIVACRAAVEGNREVGAAIGDQLPSELLFNDVLWHKPLRRRDAWGEKFSIGELWQALASAAHTDVFFDFVVIGLEIFVGDRPILAIAVVASALKLEVAITVTDSRPAKRFPADLSSANPHERLVLGKRVGVLGIFDKELAAVLVACIAEPLDRLLLEYGFLIAEAPESHPVWPHVLSEIASRYARRAGFEHEHFHPAGSKHLCHPSAARARADHYCVVRFWLRGHYSLFSSLRAFNSFTR